MVDNVLLLFGLECPKCTRPAKSHNFRTGQTIHVSPFAHHCQIHEPRPHLSYGGASHEVSRVRVEDRVETSIAEAKGTGSTQVAG